MTTHRTDFMELFHRGEYVEIPLVKKTKGNEEAYMKIEIRKWINYID